MLKQKINVNLIFIVLFFFLEVFGTKYNYSTAFHSCEKCEEKSKIFYEMEKKQFCPRCTLGQLSFYFPKYSMGEVKFYITDTVFHQINEFNTKKTKRISWSNVNQILNDKINNELKLIEKRKNLNQSFDLFRITNEILKKFNKKPLKKRKCLNCSKSRFHLVKFICCKDFVCLACCVLNSYRSGMQNNQCKFCKKLFWVTDRKEFINMSKSYILTIWRTMRVADEEREHVLEQTINQALETDILIRNECIDLYEIAQYANPQLTIPKDIANLYDEESYFEKYLFRPTISLMIGNSVVNTLLQILVLYIFEGQFNSECYWNAINFFLVNGIVNRHTCYPTDPDGQIPYKLFEKISFSINEFAKIVITWFNLFLCYFIFGETLHDGNTLFFVTAISFSTVIWALSKVIKKLHFHVKKEQTYSFL